MTTQKTIYLLFIAMLFAPLAQYHLEIFPETELNGHFEKSEAKIPELKKISLNKLRNHSFQNEIEQGWKENLGLKNWLIKSNNQMNYSLLNYTDAHAIIGKEKVMFSEYYIKSHFGEDFIGDSSMQVFVEKVKFIQDTLTNLNKFFMVLIAPGKTALQPEYIPDRYEKYYGRGRTNYESFIEFADVQNIRVFDARNYLIKTKNQHQFPLFPKNGVHWSGYAVAQVSDTLVSFIKNYSSYPMPELQLTEGIITVEEYRYTDYDIGEAMNLLCFASEEELHYPVLNFRNPPKKKPRILGVGDSFIQSFFGFYPIFDSCFTKEGSMLWYYNKQLGWPIEHTNGSIKADWMDLELEIARKEIILLEMTDENLRKVGYGFVDRLYEFFLGNEEVTENSRVLFEKLKSDPAIIEQAEQIYHEVGYTKEEMITSLAKNRLRNKWLIDYDYDKLVDLAIQSIQADEKWLQQVKEKSIRKSIPLEQAIREDAIWVVNNNLGLN